MKKALLMVGLVMVAGVGYANTTWDGSTDGDWFTSDNWSAGVPDSADWVYVENAGADTVIISNGAAEAKAMSHYGGQEIRVASTGSLTVEGATPGTDDSLYIGLGGGLAKLTVAGGTVLVTDYVRVGYKNTAGLVEMSSGSLTARLVQVPSPTAQANQIHSTTGTVSLAGGTLLCGYSGDGLDALPHYRFAIYNEIITDDTFAGSLDLCGGTLKLYGDWETSGSTQYNNLQSYITGGYITAYGQKQQGGGSRFTITYDSGTGYTTVLPKGLYTSWTGASDDDWFDPANWNYGPPNRLDWVYLKNDGASPVVIADGDAKCYSISVYGGQELQVDSGSLTLFDGSFAYGFYLGVDPGSTKLTVNGGTVTVKEYLRVGYGSTSGSVQINGGSLTAKRVHIPFNGNYQTQYCTGTVAVANGTLVCGFDGDGLSASDRFAINNTAYKDGSLDIVEGALLLYGDWTSGALWTTLDGYISNGYMTYAGQAVSSFTIDYNVTNPGYTTIRRPLHGTVLLLR
ncbi:MAG: hypothetical protein JXB13_09650 [Phycisphaerae bacterium]|nr:hypothetical protein [Phycisphaerae bacterium]